MRKASLLLVAISTCFLTYPARAERAEIKAPLVTQQTPVWCWAATASMALEMLGFPDLDPGKNYQCGVVVAAFPGCEDDCTECVTRLGPLSDLVGVLDRYKAMADKTDWQSDALFDPNYVANPRWDRVKQSLDLSYPVIAGISPDGAPEFPGRAEHVILITGYDDNYRRTGEKWVTVKDPYAYARGTSPYTSAGYRFDAETGQARLPWRVLQENLNLSSAVFLEEQAA